MVINVANSSHPFPGEEIISALPLKRDALVLMFINPIPLDVFEVSNPTPLSFMKITKLLSDSVYPTSTNGFFFLEE